MRSEDSSCQPSDAALALDSDTPRRLPDSGAGLFAMPRRNKSTGTVDVEDAHGCEIHWRAALRVHGAALLRGLDCGGPELLAPVAAGARGASR